MTSVREKDPHAEVGGIFLLLFGREVVKERRIVTRCEAMVGLSDNLGLLLVTGVDLVVVVGLPGYDGLLSKLKVVGGDGVFHSRPAAFHGLSGAGLP